MPNVYLIKIDDGKVVMQSALRPVIPGRVPRERRARNEIVERRHSGLRQPASPPVASRNDREETSLDQLLQHLLNALVLGGTYALLGIGLTLIFGIMNVVNFTHGELYTFGAYIDVSSWCISSGVNFFLALPLAIVAGWLLGAAIELVLLRPLRGADIDTTMLVMIGAWIAMQNGELWIWGGVAKSVTTPFPEAPLVLGPVSVSWLRLFVLAVALLLIVGSLSAHQPHQARQGDARDLPGSRHRGADGRQRQAGSTPRPSRSAPSLAAAAGALLGPVYRGLRRSMGDLAVAQGVCDRHPRRARQHHRRDDRRLHPGASPRSSAPATSRPAIATRWAF